MHDDCDQTGTFFTVLTDGSKLKMDGSQVNKARKLFEKEANALVSCGMPRVDVCNSLDKHTAEGKSGKSKVRRPILADGEDEDPEQHERIFEEEWEADEVPESIVGLMFDSKLVSATDAMNNRVEVALWEKVLMMLSCKLLREGVESSRQLHNLEKNESLSAGARKSLQ